MGERFVGTIHPCKIYNVLNVGAPILCIGPGSSHLTGILDALKSEVCASVRHGEVEACVREIQRIAATKRRGEEARYAAVAGEFSQKSLLPQLIRELECSPPN
jgi:colanic acid biosynthesis glycosyl transferase WcaI